MPSAEYLKHFVSDKLAAVAEEIFAVFLTSIIEYEEELERHRKLFDAVWKPVVKLRRTELPQQLVLREEASLDQDRNSIVDQEEPERPKIKEQQEELSISELGLKQEPEDPQLYSADGETNRNGDTVVDWNPEEPLRESEVKIPVITSVVSEANSDLSLYAGVSQSQELKEKCENSKSTRRKRKAPNRNFHKSQSDEDRNVAVPKSSASFTDDRYSKKSKSESEVQQHRESHVGKNVSKTLELSSRGTVSRRKTIHTVKKSHDCRECGKSFSQKSVLIVHNRTHTGERPFVCLTCGKRFFTKGHLKDHEKIHTGERPHVCQECNKSFLLKKNLIRHIKIHTGEKPYVCQTCGKGYAEKALLKFHEILHTGNRQLFSTAVENQSRDPTVDCHPEESIAESEVKTPVSISAVSEANSDLQQRSLSPAVSQSQAQRKGERETGKNPLVCKTDRCKLLSPGPLLGDKVIHTVKKPHVCQECGKSFVRKSYLIEHKRVHTGERPFVCQTCDKGFTQKSNLQKHERIHTGEKCYTCKQCGERFGTFYSLKYHIFSAH